MPPKHKPSDKERSDEIIAEARSGRQNREQGYRDRALKMFPWICARCGRELAGKKVRELTVHHKDHDHDNNPPDGSNWELLCLYCHENEHSRHEVAEAYDHSAPGQAQKSLPSKYKALADLDALLKEKKRK